MVLLSWATIRATRQALVPSSSIGYFANGSSSLLISSGQSRKISKTTECFAWAKFSPGPPQKHRVQLAKWQTCAGLALALQLPASAWRGPSVRLAHSKCVEYHRRDSKSTQVLDFCETQVGGTLPFQLPSFGEKGACSAAIPRHKPGAATILVFLCFKCFDCLFPGHWAWRSSHTLLGCGGLLGCRSLFGARLVDRRPCYGQSEALQDHVPLYLHAGTPEVFRSNSGASRFSGGNCEAPPFAGVDLVGVAFEASEALDFLHGNSTMQSV
jgi:hypothetical protein